MCTRGTKKEARQAIIEQTHGIPEFRKQQKSNEQQKQQSQRWRMKCQINCLAIHLGTMSLGS